MVQPEAAAKPRLYMCACVSLFARSKLFAAHTHTHTHDQDDAEEEKKENCKQFVRSCGQLKGDLEMYNPIHLL